MNQDSSSLDSVPVLSGSAESKTPGNTSSPSPTRPVVTYLLAALTTAIFAGMVLSQASPSHPTTEALLVRWGANIGPKTLDGQWWRLLTSVFLHIGLVHIAVNMWCLWDLGSFAEHIYGHVSYLAIYLVSGAAGAVCSLAWRPFALEAGASGAIFGIAGALIASFCFGHLPYSRKAARGALLSVIAFAGYNLFVGLFSVGAGIAAHLGGLLAGFVMGVMLVRISPRVTFALALISLGLASTVVARTHAYIVPAERGRQALAAGRSDQAILALTQSVKTNPKFAEGYSLLGQAYMQNQQPAAAEFAYRHALELQPKADGVRYQLAAAMLAQGRAADALALFKELAKSDPKSPAAQTGVGTAAELTGDYAGALEAFQRATALDPRNPQGYSNLGAASLRMRRTDDAIAAFSKAVELQPDNPKTLMALAAAYQAAGRQGEAQESYAKAIDLLQKQQKK